MAITEIQHLSAKVSEVHVKIDQLIQANPDVIVTAAVTLPLRFKQDTCGLLLDRVHIILFLQKGNT